jgi:hypothetical protein
MSQLHFTVHALNNALLIRRSSTDLAAAATDGSVMAVEKTLRLESTKRFPLSHRHYDGY